MPRPRTTEPTPQESGDADDPVWAFLLERRPELGCELCGGLMNGNEGGHDSSMCPGREASGAQLMHMALAKAAAAELDALRAHALLELVVRSARGVVQYPLQMLEPHEAARVRTHVNATRQAGGNTAAPARVTEDRAPRVTTMGPEVQVTDLKAQVAALQSRFDEAMREQRPGTRHATAPEVVTVECLMKSLEAGRAHTREVLEQVTRMTNAEHGRTGVSKLTEETSMAYGGLLAGYDPASAQSGIEFCLGKLRLGGDLGMDRRVMVYPAAMLHGYNEHAQPTTGVGGARVPQLGCAANMFTEASKVTYDTRPTSLYGREAAALARKPGDAVGQLGVTKAGEIAIEQAKRELVLQPGASGFPDLGGLAEWCQGMVNMSDELRKVDAALQYHYSEEFQLWELVDQHRLGMMTVYDDFFRSVRAPKTAFGHFVAMEEALRRRMMQLRPRKWDCCRTEPTLNRVLRAFALKAEQEPAEDFSAGGRPGGGRGGPGPASKATGDVNDGAAQPDLRSKVSFGSMGEIVAAYKDVRTGKGHAFCCAHNYSACPNKTETDQGVTWCTDAKGGKRLHLCVRCGGGHKMEGEGKCSKPHVR